MNYSNILIVAMTGRWGYEMLNHRIPLKSIYSVFYVIIILVSEMGLGCFLYNTSLLPDIPDDDMLNFKQSPYIISTNFINYILGSLLFLFSAFYCHKTLKELLLSFSIITFFLLFTVLSIYNKSRMVANRFLSGIGNAVMITCSSKNILQYTEHCIITSIYFGAWFGMLSGDNPGDI
ncbi:YbfB/YjiJ family MFS transporter [Xenorhabdus thuongxuanensis]|uniref:Uncharacterized protein n=1 Tax=Xenorhabdus thuongxuanensis TaxID=1873484 RepID=A0A1Q5U665_9GAMM|nr:YbfB/YjiJ family MFS transporter [Xenorhabdus thuongxuanensis]OKP07955.1 hypothetical protein Xentx_01006 [Xenorhabdus thuongxuanensis]